MRLAIATSSVTITGGAKTCEAVAWVHGHRFPMENSDSWAWVDDGVAVQKEDVKNDEKKKDDEGEEEEEEEEDEEAEEDDDEGDSWKAVPEWICSVCT